MKEKAVAGFIATNPGRTRFNNSTSKDQPARARTPREIASALAAAGNPFNRIGSSEWLSLARSFSNTNYTCNKNSNVGIRNSAMGNEFKDSGIQGHRGGQKMLTRDLENMGRGKAGDQRPL